MSMRFIVLIMLLLFLVEGTIVPWLVPDGFAGRLVPHFTFVMVLYAALYHSRHSALLLGFGFGMLQDVVYYGHLIGVHAFTMGLIGYAVGIMLERKRSTLFMALAMIGFADLFYEVLVFYVYKVFRITNETFAWAMYDHILPSLFLQQAFALAVYIPARRWFSEASRNRLDKDRD
ncbi:rod shape-determining protein MreD [Paenibacillus beijingensis]|uniref:Rod shape-determining protein MreD n=1 Tax=Paenibacillus beijingensis TaxID=1126833 RepID=A0A0D5NLB1_9BACL|nr:rod shape-determining protein MreD [Paenibacillus beijingensis]AJY76061.1 rod shape-determining protein MreD [Paenibacillus beijingensis]